MSYITYRGEDLILTKVTELGRKNIAKGTFNFAFYSIGDSEIDYSSTVNRLKLLKTKDSHPKQVSFLEFNEDCNSYVPITSLNSDLVELTLRNDARNRGFYDKCIIDNNTIDLNLFKMSGTISLDILNGTKQLDLSGITNEEFNLIDDGDILMLKIPNLSTQTEPFIVNKEPVPYMYFSLKKINLTSIFEVDRFLPIYNNISNSSLIDVDYVIIPNKENSLSFYSHSGQTINWNSETLEFYEACNSGDTKIWNLNIPFCSTIMGTTGCTEDHLNYGSQNYTSLMTYLNECNECDIISGNDCNDSLESSDYNNESLAIIHFSNFHTRNEYGEFLYINSDSNLFLCLPNIMWHNRYFSGSTVGNAIGMRFMTSEDKKYLYPENDNLVYYDLIEDSQYLNPNDEPLVVGKVFPNLKIIVLSHPELINVLSYKSNRNFSLPKLIAKQVSPTYGLNTGILKRKKRIYLTYTLTSNMGITNMLPQGVVSYLDNVGNIDRDIEFKIEDINKFPYMRYLEDGLYDGLGFSANNFKILYQIQDIGVKPVPSEWNIVDFTNNRLRRGNMLDTIDPLILENQIAQDNNFLLNTSRVSQHGEGIYNNDLLCVSCNSSNLTMGDETVFIGNIQTKIGAKVYKKVINILIDELNVKNTTNKSYSSGLKKISEISFYNSEYEQIAVSKMSIPIPLRKNSITEIEINYDF